MYWLISLPLIQQSSSRTWEQLQSKTDSDNNTNYRLNIPDLRVGTLDTLMQLSDDLSKVRIGRGGVKGWAGAMLGKLHVLAHASSLYS